MLFRWLKVFIAASLLCIMVPGHSLAARGYDPALEWQTLEESPVLRFIFPRGSVIWLSGSREFLSR